MNSTRNLHRNPGQRVIAGVCSGIAEYLSLDPVIVRLVFFFTGRNCRRRCVYLHCFMDHTPKKWCRIWLSKVSVKVSKPTLWNWAWRTKSGRWNLWNSWGSGKEIKFAYHGSRTDCDRDSPVITQFFCKYWICRSLADSFDCSWSCFIKTYFKINCYETSKCFLGNDTDYFWFVVPVWSTWGF